MVVGPCDTVGPPGVVTTGSSEEEPPVTVVPGDWVGPAVGVVADGSGVRVEASDGDVAGEEGELEAAVEEGEESDVAGPAGVVEEASVEEESVPSVARDDVTSSNPTNNEKNRNFILTTFETEVKSK